MGFWKRLRQNEKGNALVMMGAALPVLIGFAGLATDTVQWALWKRQLQRAADSAAIAGVYAKIQPQPVDAAINTDLDKNNQAKIQMGLNLLSGYPQITYPANTPTYQNAVAVGLAVQKKLGFSSFFLSTPPVITANATAATIPTGVYCVVSLEPSNATGIVATGDGTIDLGCGMITNSTSLTAAIATGSSKVVATPIAAVGDIKESDNWGSAELLPFTVKEDDPFDTVYPTKENCPGPNLKVNSNGVLDRSSDSGAVCFNSMDLNGDVKLGPATYVIDGGNLSIGAQAKVSCTGCTFVLTNSSTSSTAPIGNVDINGGAEVKLSAPTTGPYDGILIYQDRRASSGPSEVNKINGNANSLLSGAFYFPTRQLDINGTANLNFNCAQFVARNVSFSGNGSITNSCTGGYGDDAIMGQHVRLVG